MLVAAKNPCACGFLGHPKKGCSCTAAQLAQHAARISGPVLDRLDLQIEVPALTSAGLQERHGEERITATRLAEALQYRAYDASRFIAR